MSSLTFLAGFAGCMLLASAAACRYALRWPLPFRARISLAAGSAALLLLPVGELMMVEYLRGVIGDLSIVSQLMLAAFLASYVAGRPLLDTRQTGAVMAVALAAAIALYPAALGLAPLDPYALGYASLYFALALTALTIAAWYAGFVWLAACLLLATCAKVAGVLESRNLWDYLIDPLLAIYAACWVARLGLRAYRVRPQASSQP